SCRRRALGTYRSASEGPDSASGVQSPGCSASRGWASTGRGAISSGLFKPGQAPIGAGPGSALASSSRPDRNSKGPDAWEDAIKECDQATALVSVGSIVIPLAVLSAVCWFFWKHRHEE